MGSATERGLHGWRPGRTPRTGYPLPVRPGPAFPLVRRICEDGVVRELVWPPDKRPIERPVGSGTPPEAPPEAEAPPEGGYRLGQLVGRNVTPGDHTRPLALPLLRSSCNGTGSCCGTYHHIPMTTEDRERIVPLLEDQWDRPVPLEDLFYPAFDEHPDNPLNVVAIEGSCAFRDSDGLCAVHKAGGAQAKPQTCLSFPAHMVVCGERWYASLRPECACAARTALEGPKLSEEPVVWAELRKSMLAVWTVPSLVEVDRGRKITRTTYRRWMEEQVAGLSTTFDPVETLYGGLHDLDMLAELPVDSGLPERAEELLDDAWLETAHTWLTNSVDIARFAQARRSPARLAVEWALHCVTELRNGHSRRIGGSRGRRADWNRRAALTTALLMHGHGLLEEPTLRPALLQLIRVVAAARACRAVKPLEDWDTRLEEMTTWFYLWRTLGRGVW